MWGTLPAFAGAVLLGGLVPGPTMVIMLRQTVRSGRGAAVWSLAGNEMGVLLWGVLAAFGLSGVLAASRTAYDVMRVTGAGVLIFFGVQAWLQAGKGGFDLDGGPPEKRAGATANFRIGLVTVVSNPKYGVFALSFLPQFVAADLPVRSVTLLLSVVWIVLDAALYFTMILCVHRMRRMFERDKVRRVLERISAIVLFGLGVRLMVAGP
jgi:threonine/homoserine/homoserine lactone efflux protein